MSQLIFDKRLTAPSSPATGSVTVYVKSDGRFYYKDESDTEYPLTDLDTVNSLDFSTTTTDPNTIGRLRWNDTDGTLDLGLKGGNVVLQIGQEQLVRVYNNTGTALNDLDVIRITGSQGQRLTVSKALANSDITSDTTFAVVTEPISNNSEGFATTSGLVRGVNTQSFPEGSALYLSPTVSGGLTSTKPVWPNKVVLVGWCIRSNASTGIIFVNIISRFHLEELHNVFLTGLSNNDVLSYDTTNSRWINRQITPSTIYPTRLVSTNTSVLSTDFTIRVNTNLSNVTITLPDASSLTGKVYNIKKISDNNTCFVVPFNGTQTIDGVVSASIIVNNTTLTIQSNGTTWDII